ncbi:MAG: protein-L-isoaspartate O-methyltransferase [Gammaproteobacteria bacterium]|nr:protein-L-isoaspartate O-methyltransferase [Gammaproteobacteria bacterium]
MNQEKARYNMVEQQIRPWGVFQPSIINLMTSIPREIFVPSETRSLAFADLSIDIGHHQKMYQPKQEARMLQALDLKESDEVLEIGTGTGFTTALLASMSHHVVSIDQFDDFIQQADKKLAQCGISNVTTDIFTANKEWHPSDRFDVIVCTPAISHSPNELLKQLTSNGRLFSVEFYNGISYATLYRKTDDNITRQRLFELATPKMSLDNEKQEFVF